jgi:hypothetical protein
MPGIYFNGKAKMFYSYISYNVEGKIKFLGYYGNKWFKTVLK